MDTRLTDKVAIVTGGSRGIGWAIVELFAAEGADVTFFYRDNAAAADEVVASGKAAGRRIAAEKVDIRDSAACAAAVERVAERCGRIDILVNNAGIIRDNQLAAFDDDDVRSVLDTNVGGAFNAARAVVPHMIVQRAAVSRIGLGRGDRGGRGDRLQRAGARSTPSPVRWRSSWRRARSP
jgi:3-oxoacyl-[acyl-carrier protein] reductase